MKTYKDFEKCYIGESDSAFLTFVSIYKNNFVETPIYFGEDGCYSAYIVNKETDIPKHYQLIMKCKRLLKIYDDFGLAQEFTAKDIEVYRAGDFGCIIKLI